MASVTDDFIPQIVIDDPRDENGIHKMGRRNHHVDDVTPFGSREFAIAKNNGDLMLLEQLPCFSTGVAKMDGPSFSCGDLQQRIAIALVCEQGDDRNSGVLRRRFKGSDQERTDGSPHGSRLSLALAGTGENTIPPVVGG